MSERLSPSAAHWRQKLAEYLREAVMLERALAASRRKISVFLLTVLLLVVVIRTMMYVIEGEEHGFVVAALPKERNNDPTFGR